MYSRDEWDAGGDVSAKVVEEVFERFAGVLNLHVGGEVISTTAEHPFFAYGRGWVPAHELQPGDRLLCADRTLVTVEEVFNTGEWVPVYNLRIADYHTYFVGNEGWGWQVWAHNACVVFVQEPISSESGEESLTFARNARDARRRHQVDPKWRNGGGNYGKINYRIGGISGSEEETRMYGANSKRVRVIDLDTRIQVSQGRDFQDHSEIQAFRALADRHAGRTDYLLVRIYSERSMCEDCQDYFRLQLRQAHVPTSRIIMVYYMWPHVSNSNLTSSQIDSIYKAVLGD